MCSFSSVSRYSTVFRGASKPVSSLSHDDDDLRFAVAVEEGVDDVAVVLLLRAVLSIIAFQKAWTAVLVLEWQSS